MRRGFADAARARAAALILAALAGLARGEELRNWFDDPFVPLSADRPGCPEPAGPRVTEAERRQQSHRRAEKGTTCWLAQAPGCERASAYAYDRAIAERIVAAWRVAPPVGSASLWLTVQGRVVYVEGCVDRAGDAAAIEAFMRAVPEVDRALAIVTDDRRAPPPYRVMPAR